MQAYSVTINLPVEMQDLTEPITEAYLSLISKNGGKQYLQVYEIGAGGKRHSHIAYLSTPTTTTSNETRKFKSCYEDHFKKKEHPNAIIHKQHNSIDVLCGYLLKTNPSEYDYQTSFPKNYLKQCQSNYQVFIPEPDPVQKKHTYFTVNEIANGFVQYLEDENIVINFLKDKHDHNETETYNALRHYLRLIEKHVLFSTYMKINKQKLVEYVSFKVNTEKLYQKKTKKQFI